MELRLVLVMPKVDDGDDVDDVVDDVSADY